MVASKLSARPDTIAPVAGADPLFTLEDVWASRDGADVIRGLTATIEGPSTAIVGPSGAGKSTLLRLLNRLADPARGRVLFRGRDVREDDVLRLRRRVVLLPQLPAPLAETVADDVRYAAPDADVGHLLEQAGLDASYADRATDRLSVGEQQRVMLARALALDPEVLLLDEPTSALDEQARQAVEQTIARLDTPIVLVTHDPAQAERLTRRRIELSPK
jgi:putative ABC transport system ATP-binding protein